MEIVGLRGIELPAQIHQNLIRRRRKTGKALPVKCEGESNMVKCMQKNDWNILVFIIFGNEWEHLTQEIFSAAGTISAFMWKQSHCEFIVHNLRVV